MSVIAIKNTAELESALASAKGGDVLKLAGGNYGDVTISKSFASPVTITSADDSNPATFKHLLVKDSKNLTIDDIDVKGGVNGRGLEVKGGSDIKVIDCDIRDTWFGATFIKVKNLEVTGNDFTDLWHDAMRFVTVENAKITGNTYIEKDSEPGYTHKDFIQFWTNKANGEGPSKNVVISGNTFISDDNLSHGIFIIAEDETSGKHQNITITDNVLKASQTHAITVAHANGVLIQNNLVEQYGKIVPVINVTPESTNVKILNNTAPSVPNQGNSTWVVSGNKETGAANIWHWTDGQTGTKIANTGGTAGASIGKSTIPAPADDGQGAAGNGKAGEVRFDGDNVQGTKKATVGGLDFGEGDTLVFIDYDKGTLADKSGGNLVWNNAEATYVKVDSLVDLQELDACSKMISTAVSGDDLVMTIKQDTGTQVLTIEDWGKEFAGTWNDALF